jgi:hypothetical protein
MEELEVSTSDPLHITTDPRNNLGIVINYPFEYQNTSIQVIITVSDELGTFKENLNIRITDNFPPQQVSQLPAIVFLEDTIVEKAFNLDKYFVDLDDSSIEYTIYNSTINVSLDNENFVSFSPVHNWFGTEYVRFIATDHMGAFQEVQIIATVLPVNDPPVLAPLPEQVGAENHRWALDLSKYITDVDNDISELKITVDDYHVEVAGANLIFLGSPATQEYVDVRVNDGEFSDSRSIHVKIDLDDKPGEPAIWNKLSNIFLSIILIEVLVLLLAAMVQRRRNKFTVEEVFLIYSGGTLIPHLTRRSQANVDDEIFSAMFTAVQEFISDTFTKSKKRAGEQISKGDWALDELKLGENNILIERSKNTYLAVIFSGKSSKRLRKIVLGLLKRIEDEYGEVLTDWQGDIEKVIGTEKILKPLIKPLSVKEQKAIVKAESSRLGLARAFKTDKSRPATGILNYKTPQTKVEYPKSINLPLDSKPSIEDQYKSMKKPQNQPTQNNKQFNATSKLDKKNQHPTTPVPRNENYHRVLRSMSTQKTPPSKTINTPPLPKLPPHKDKGNP